MPFKSAFIVLTVAFALAAQPAAPAKKQLVAHRGASGYAPEHTIFAYKLAIEQGADFVEQDLAVTRDGVLVSIHDLTLERTTNVEEVFPDRFVEDKTGANPGKHWLVNDFTLAEITQLDAGSWFDKKFAGAKILTFQEAIDLVRGKAGLYPELKDPEFYRQRGINTAKLLEEVIAKNNLAADPKTPLIIQSFDDVTLKQLAKELPKVPRVYLLEPRAAGQVDAPEKLKAIAGWATGLGPNKIIVQQTPEIVAWAHAAGLTVTPWTFRASNTTFPSVKDEMAKYLYEYGVDALFTDNPDMFPRR
jgi:glycerophosphoryl diester phosphodiesterase